MNLVSDFGKKFEFDNNFLIPKNFGGILLYQFGELCCEPNYTISAHKQWCYEISYVISGCGYMYTNGIATRVKEGDIYMNSYGQIHEIQSDSNSFLRFAYIAFKIDNHVTESDMVRLKNFYETIGFLYLRNNKEVWLPFSQAVHEFYYESEFNNLMITGYLKQILISVYRNYKQVHNRSYPEKRLTTKEGIIYATIQHVEKNIYDIKNVRDVTDYLGYSTCYISHVFKDKTGTTLQNFIGQKKIEKAVELLTYSDMSITQIAYKLNYANIQSFSRAFKRIMGYCPSCIEKNKEGSK